MKKIKIKVKDKQSLLDALRNEGFFLPANCGGQGRCGKCKVGILAVDDGCPDKQEVLRDWRLACQVCEEGIYQVEIPDYEEDEVWAAGICKGDEVFVSLAISDSDREDMASVKTEDGTAIRRGNDSISEGKTALAVDIGTTTVAACLIDTVTGEVLRTATGINHQRVYGADVLSRIDAANRGEGGKLQELIIQDLNSICHKLKIAENEHEEGNVLTEDILNLTMPVIIAGNTTMEHLLQGLSCRTLGLYPFEAVDISLHRYHNMTILPGISTYVGADIVSGIISCGIDQKDEVSILVDLGTNGEMVIGNKDRILVASTAAGPAFEGGNISCGMAGIPGAIDRVAIEYGKARVSSIANRKPVGLCGTGVVETVYELFKEGIMDETGLLDDPWFDQGFPLTDDIVFTSKDVREVQLAKAAIRAGIEILIEAYGIRYDQIDKLYLAGGFGLKLDGKKAAGIGMLPEELSDRIVAAGNTSLKGAVIFAKDTRSRNRFEQVIDISKEINLSNHSRFNDLYIEHMFFPEAER